MADQSTSAANQARLSDNVAGGVAYIFVIPAVFFLRSDQYKKRAYVRFHSWQAIYFGIACILISVALGVVIELIPALRFLEFDHFPLISLALVIFWMIALIKAFNGEWYKLPIVGPMAARRAGC